MRIQSTSNSKISVGILTLAVFLSQIQNAFAADYSLSDDKYLYCPNHIYQLASHIVVCDEDENTGAVRKCYYENNNGQPGNPTGFCEFGSTNGSVSQPGSHR